MTTIDNESMLCTYEGHTIFSIFWDNISIYEKILRQLNESEFPIELDFDGLDSENAKLRRLYRILSLPTGDLRHRLYKLDEGSSEKEVKRTCTSYLLPAWVRKLLSIPYQASQSGSGFKSIVKKSLHFANTRFRENLMEIAMLCRENCIATFVENQHDITLLFNSMTPATVEFFENAFNQTRFTKSVKNLQWQVGTQMEVVGQKSQVFNESIAAAQLKNVKTKDNDDEIQSRQVIAQMLPIEWVFAKYGGNEQVSFRELVVALSESPFDSLFSTELVITLTEHIWSRYYKSVFRYCFLPFCVYFIVTQVFLSTYTLSGIDPSSSVLLPYLMTLIIFLGVIFFLFFEMIVALRSGLEYFSDPFNYIDLSSFALNIILVIDTHRHGYGSKVSETIRAITSLAVILMWFKVFYWMRLFDSTSFYVKLIRETVYDIRYFLILFIVILLTFANALLVANHGRGDEEEIVDSVFGVALLDAVLN